ncbi:MAG: Lrp/AsnC family transcriptional regulator [Promethearchaeota archaeon]
MDAKDHLLLDALKEDASLSVAKLALKTNLPATTVYNRIKKLKAHGIIKNYTINIDKNLVHGSIVGFILIKAASVNSSGTDDQREIIRKLMEHPSVEDAAIITGEKDILTRIRVKSIEDLNSFILDYLRKVPGIQDSTTMISLEYYEK